MEELNTLNNHTVEMPYDPALVDNIRRVLERQVQSARPQTFEIYVDGLRVVPRTTLVENFELFKTFVQPQTRRIIVTVFKGIRTPNCTTYVFTRNQEPKEQLGSIPAAVPQGYLSGTQVQQMIDESSAKMQLNYKVERLEEKLQERDLRIGALGKELHDAEEYIAKLHSAIELLKTEKESKSSAATQTLLDMVKNPPLWAQVLLSKTQAAPTKQLEGTQTRNDDPAEVVDLRAQPETLSEDDKRYMTVIRRMEEELEERELKLLMRVNEKLITEPEQLPVVADLIGVAPPETT